jgi:DNA-binding transcriptional regulator YiaG
MAKRRKNPMTDWTSEKIKFLREKVYQESQEEFCRRLRVSVDTLRYWEQKRGVPGGPATVVFDFLAAEVGQLLDPEPEPEPAKSGE